MPSINVIPVDKLARLVGTPKCPLLIDIRTDAEFAADPRLIPGSRRRAIDNLPDWAAELSGKSVVVICQDGDAAAHGVAAWLRAAGGEADVLEGGAAGWFAGGAIAVTDGALPPRDALGRTLWVTRARPKVDRIACPWLIRRFVDPTAMFLFVPPAEVPGVAVRMGATAFDIEGVHWSHRGERCTFDVMLEEFGLAGHGPLDQLSAIVRGADTARPDLVPEAAGLLAVSLGLSRMYAVDLEQLDAGMLVYDALYRWCRDATAERHDWTSHSQVKGKVAA